MICLSINRQLSCPGSCVPMSVQLGFAYYLPTSYLYNLGVQLVCIKLLGEPGSHDLRVTAAPIPVDGQTSLYGDPGKPQTTSGGYSGANIDGSEVVGDTI